MNKQWKIYVITTIACLVLISGARSFAVDSCGGPYGIIDAPSGNVDQASGGAWYTPIGGQSTWSSSGLGDQDWDTATCECQADTIANKRWRAYRFTPTSSTATSPTFTADTDPRTDGWIARDLDDTGTYINDGGYIQVASVAVNIVIPNAEAQSVHSTPGCSAPTPYGCHVNYDGTVSRSGVTLSFDHCKVCEADCGDYTRNTCDAGDNEHDHCTRELSLASNKWSYDQFRFCSPNNTDFGVDGCTTTNNCTWKIKAPGGGWHTYYTPLYTNHTTRYFADMTCVRS